jgi:hypothetical protein
MEARRKVRRRSWILLTCAIDSPELVALRTGFLDGRATPTATQPLKTIRMLARS